MIKIGFLIKSPGASQQSINLCHQMNKLVTEHPEYSVCTFYRAYDIMPIKPLFALLSTYEAWSFDGVAIATDMDSAHILLTCPSPKKKFFYVYDMEWVFQPKFNYNDVNKIYNNPELPLIVRSQFHYDVISNLWQQPVTIIPEYNYVKFIEFLKEQS